MVKEGYKHSPFGLIPKGWEVRRASEIASIEYGISEAVSNNTDPSIGIPIITGANIQIEGYLDMTKKVYIAPKDNERFQLMKGDLLFNWRSGSQKHVGKTAIFNLEGEHTYASFILRIRMTDENHNRYYHYLLNYLKETGYYSAETSVQVNFKLNAKTFRDLELLVPPLPEQKKIAKILSTVDEHIDEVDGMIDDLKELKKGLMQKLLTEGIGHTEFKDSAVGRIPVEWEVKSFKDVFTTVTDYVANGSFASLKENVKYLDGDGYAILMRIADYSNDFKGNFVYVGKDSYDYLKKTRVEKGDIILSNVGAVGTIFRAPNLNKPMTLGPNSILVKSKGMDDYLYYWLSSYIGQSSLKSITTTTAQPKFNKTDFKTIKCAIPPINEQRKIASILKDVDDRVKDYSKDKNDLIELKRGLMQQLLTGKARVKIDN